MSESTKPNQDTINPELQTPHTSAGEESKEMCTSDKKVEQDTGDLAVSQSTERNEETTTAKPRLYVDAQLLRLEAINKKRDETAEIIAAITKKIEQDTSEMESKSNDQLRKDSGLQNKEYERIKKDFEERMEQSKSMIQNFEELRRLRARLTDNDEEDDGSPVSPEG